MEPRGYVYGGGSGAGGKIRRHHPSRAAAVSPYARPAPAPAPAAAAASQGGGWISRIISAGASRLLPSLFRKPPPQLTASAPPPAPEPLEDPPSRDLRPEPRPEQLDAPSSSLPPPLEDYLSEGEENSGGIANDDNMGAENPQISAKEKEDRPRNFENHSRTDLEELLKQRTFTRSEFEYLSKVLWSRTIGSSSLKPDDGNIRKTPFSDQDNGSRRDFSITTYSVADKVVSPAEFAKAYMGSKSSKASPLRLRLHDPSSMPTKLFEASMIQKAKPPTIPLLQGSRFQSYKTSDRLESNYSTPNRSTIYKMSSSPYFKSGASSKDLFSTVSSPFQTPSNVHSVGRQVLKRKSGADNNEIKSVGRVRRMHQRYNRTSPLLETRPGYSKYSGGCGSKFDESSDQILRTQKRRCLDKVSDATHGRLDGTAHANNFGQTPVQSVEMAAKILKQLDTLVPAQMENMSEIKQKYGNAIGVRTSLGKEVSAESNDLGPSPSNVEECSFNNGSNTSNKSDNERPPTSLRSHAPSNLVLSSEIDQNKMPIPFNGFTFPVTAVLGAHSQAPPTPTLASPPMLPVEKQQPSVVFSASNTSMESPPRILQSAQEEGSIAHKFDKKLNALPSKNSGQGAAFTSDPVFKFVKSQPTSLSNGPGHMSNSTVSAIQPSNGSTKAAPFPFAGSTISTTASKSTQSSSAGGSFTISNTAMGSLVASSMFASTTSQSSLASSGTVSPSAPFSFSPHFGTASASAAHDKSKAVSSSDTFSSSQKFENATSAAQDRSKAVGNSKPFGFSKEFGTVGSSTALDKYKATSPEPAVIFGNQNCQSGNNNLRFNYSEKSNNNSSQSFADSQIGSAPVVSTPSNASSVFPWASGSVCTPVAMTAAPSSATSFAFGSNPASPASPMFGSKTTIPISPTFGLPNSGSASSHFSSPSAVFSFTSSTPSIPNPSPTTPFGGPTVQMNEENMAADRNGSPFQTPSPFGLSSNSPTTPSFTTPPTQFASNTLSSPGVFGFGQQSQASSGGFSMGLGGGNDKSSRRIIRVKKRK